MKTCGAKHPDIMVLNYRSAVRCIREDPNHSGHHIAAPFGKLITWIEPSKTRGAAKLVGDDAPVVSPSDNRTRRVVTPSDNHTRLGWWQRFVKWLRAGKDTR